MNKRMHLLQSALHAATENGTPGWLNHRTPNLVLPTNLENFCYKITFQNNLGIGTIKCTPLPNCRGPFDMRARAKLLDGKYYYMVAFVIVLLKLN